MIRPMEPISFTESQRLLAELVQKLRAKTEQVETTHALSRVLSSAVHAQNANPPSAVAAMDGIAVNFVAIPDALVRLREDQWQYINTGEVLPEKFNTVIRIEDVNWEEKVPVLDKKPILYHNVRRPGEDFEKGSLLLVAEQQLQPQDISLLLTAGVTQVEVYKKPVVSFVPTGSELVPSTGPLQKGQIRETNSAMVGSLVERHWGGQFRLLEPVPDDADDLAQVLKLSAPQSDVVVISAGTSKGTRDITAEVVGFMGSIIFHGVKISPGKPVLLGEISGCPVLGLPGYPAAAYLCSQLYLRQIVCAMSRVRSELPRTVFISAEEIPAKNVDSFHRVNCFDVDGQTFVRKMEGGAGSISSVSFMDGWMHVPPQTPIKKRDGVRIDLVHNRAANTIAGRGAGDPGLTQLFSMLQRSLPSQRVLFWNCEGADALQSIVERNVHFATLATPVTGSDPFETFAKQLQETMHRYRAFTRSLGVLMKNPAHQEFSRGMKIAVAVTRFQAWTQFLQAGSHQNEYLQVFSASASDQDLLNAFDNSNWDAIFVDLRFLKVGIPERMQWKEHLDVVIPDSYIELPGMRRLIELLLSDEFWMWLETQNGCEVTHRGLVE
jgi:molybdenum cofactor synthesis domain-containing protein